jgi:hypothetical protein
MSVDHPHAPPAASRADVRFAALTPLGGAVLLGVIGAWYANAHVATVGEAVRSGASLAVAAWAIGFVSLFGARRYWRAHPGPDAQERVRRYAVRAILVIAVTTLVVALIAFIAKLAA